MREESDEGRSAENSREGRKIMMRNKRRSGGSDKRLRGINVKSSSKRTRGGSGSRESENKPPNLPEKELLDSNLRPSRFQIVQLLDERCNVNFTAD